MDPNTPQLSFISIVDFSENARWLFLTPSVSDLLGYESRELIGRPALELVHPEEYPKVKQMHYDTIRQDKAAVLAYLRMKHKDPIKGYILCSISRTVVYNVLVGSVSYAERGAKAMHNASTAQEVEVITKTAQDFQLRRWGDPSPMPPSPMPSPQASALLASAPASDTLPEPVITFAHMPSQSLRTALILERFSVRCPVIYCSNDLLLQTTTVMGRSFFDFVMPESEETVKKWIDVIKQWGVNERGQPSDGGFGFGKFRLCRSGRDSSVSQPTHGAQRRRDAWSSSKSPPARSNSSSNRSGSLHSQDSRQQRITPPPPREDGPFVDAIFSAHSDGILLILRYATGK